MCRQISALCLIVIGLYLPGATGAEEPAQEKTKGEVPSIQPGEEDGFQWMLRQRAFPLGYIPSGVDVAALNRIRTMERLRRPELKPDILSAAAIGANWTSIGPAPLLANFATGDLPAGGTNYFGGSIWALAVDPTNKNTVYLGGAGGGVWKSTDGGAHWISTTDGQPWLSIGALAIDPSNPNTVYAGTGWPFQLYGEGLLKTTDGGTTWSYIPGPFSAPAGSTDYFGGGSRLLALSVSPSNSLVLLAAVWGWGTARGGIFRSADGGSTWAQVLSGGRCASVFFYPTDGNTAYAALGDYYGSASDGIYKSANGGLTWTPANGSGTNVLPSTNVGSIILTPALSNPTTMYAAISQSSSTTFLGFYKTTDGGQNWTQPSSLLDLPADPPQTMAVSPTNPLVIFTGSHDYINRSVDGGVTWTRAIPPRFTDNRFYLFSADGGRLYLGDDAGVYSTDTPLTTFQMTNLNATLPLVLYYPGLSLHPTNPSVAYGGAQDLGISHYTGSPTWTWVYNCDGGATAIDFTTPATVYATCQNSATDFIIKSTNSGATWTGAHTGIPTTDHLIFIPPLVMDPANSQRLYFGATHLYQTTNGGTAWQSISPAMTTDTSGFSSIAAIAVAPGNADFVYAGTADGAVWVSQNATLGTSSTWTKITTGLPPRAVTALAVHPSSATTAYVLFSGFSGFGDTKGHIFKTVDAGAHWSDISGSLPNIPLNDCVVDPDIAGTLYVASDMSVFVSTDDGASWNVMGNGLPRAVVHSLKLHRPTRMLRAATFGRGMFDIPVPLPGTTAPALKITMSHQGSFAKSQTGATYQVTVANQAGAGPTAGMLTVAETAPYGLTLTGMSGNGWTCSNPSCTRSDPLPAESSYPALTVTVNVAANPPATVVNQATVSGGSSPPATALDTTGIGIAACDLNNSNAVDSADVVYMIQEVLGLSQAHNDLNLDGFYNVVDVQIVVNAGANLVCAAK